MKIGMTSLTLKEYETDDVVNCARQAGVCGIEWGVCPAHVVLGDKERAQRIKTLCAKNDIEIFSLGSYCRMEKREECEAVVQTAVLLGAPVIRVWAGGKSPSECDADYVSRIVSNSAYMADLAKESNVKIGFEYHHHTLTENSKSAVNFIRMVGRENAGLYWQPNCKLTTEENKMERDDVLPYFVGNFHIHNFSTFNGYGRLEEIEDKLRVYFTDIRDENYNLLIEFVKDQKPENLMRDADILRKLFC